MNEYDKKVKEWCLKNTNYRVFKTLTGISDFASIVTFTFYKHRKEIADNLSSKNTLLNKIMESK